MIHHPENIHHQEQLFIIRKLKGGHPVSDSSNHLAVHPGAHHSIPAHGVPTHGFPAAGPMPAQRSAIHCFFFLCSGTVLAQIGEKTYLIKEHELVVIPAGQVFSVKYFENSHGYMGGFHPKLFPNENLLAKYDFLRVWGSPKIELDQFSFSRQLPLFDRMYEEFVTERPGMEIIKAYLNAILAEADAVYRKTIKDVVVHNNSICNRFLQMLFSGEEGAQVLQIAEYAHELNITPNHLNKIVKGATGKSTSTWIEEAVMQRAKALLATTDLPLSEIAARTGIMDQSYFARKFKKHEGVSPSEFRQRR
ncbi:MAG: AraC family transcriptional regulator [Bacteroidales bacterium]|nr:AraC family transcriptional regulator [Bacteroidales bacterium]